MMPVILTTRYAFHQLRRKWLYNSCVCIKTIGGHAGCSLSPSQLGIPCPPTSRTRIRISYRHDHQVSISRISYHHCLLLASLSGSRRRTTTSYGHTQLGWVLIIRDQLSRVNYRPAERQFLMSALIQSLSRPRVYHTGSMN